MLDLSQQIKLLIVAIMSLENVYKKHYSPRPWPIYYHVFMLFKNLLALSLQRFEIGDELHTAVNGSRKSQNAKSIVTLLRVNVNAWVTIDRIKPSLRLMAFILPGIGTYFKTTTSIYRIQKKKCQRNYSPRLTGTIRKLETENGARK